MLGSGLHGLFRDFTSAEHPAWRRSANLAGHGQSASRRAGLAEKIGLAMGAGAPPSRMLRIVALATPVLLGGTTAAPHPAPVLWAWERAEVLDRAPPSFGVAAVVGFVRLEAGAVAVARGRRLPLVLRDGAPPPIGVVHIEID